MKSSLKVLALSAFFGLTFVAFAQDGSTPQERIAKPAEMNLVGVNLLDTGLMLIQMFGSPDDIIPLSIGGGGVGPGGGFGGGGTGGDGGPSFAGASGGGGGAAAEVRLYGDPFKMGRGINQARPGQVPGRGSGAASAGQGGVSLPGSRGGGGGGGGVGGGGGGASSGRVLFTRWIYRVGSSRYAFVLDKFNRIVQIEAMGLSDSKVNTSRDIKFGSTFADVITKYNVPDAYEISGDTIVMRYLVRDHVAFRLSRLRQGGPHQVTGIVVAAGKA